MISDLSRNRYEGEDAEYMAFIRGLARDMREDGVFTYSLAYYFADSLLQRYHFLLAEMLDREGIEAIDFSQPHLARSADPDGKPLILLSLVDEQFDAAVSHLQRVMDDIVVECSPNSGPDLCEIYIDDCVQDAGNLVWELATEDLPGDMVGTLSEDQSDIIFASRWRRNQAGIQLLGSFLEKSAQQVAQFIFDLPFVQGLSVQQVEVLLGLRESTYGLGGKQTDSPVLSSQIAYLLMEFLKDQHTRQKPGPKRAVTPQQARDAYFELEDERRRTGSNRRTSQRVLAERLNVSEDTISRLVSDHELEWPPSR